MKVCLWVVTNVQSAPYLIVSFAIRLRNFLILDNRLRIIEARRKAFNFLGSLTITYHHTALMLPLLLLH